MGFKNFVTNYLEEDAILNLKNIGIFLEDSENLIGIYKITDNISKGIEAYDTSLFEDDILGCIVIKYFDDEKCFEIEKVNAVNGYGPLLYLLGMQLTKRKGLSPYHDPNYVSNEAKNIWKNFHNGLGKELVTFKPLSKNYHREDYLNNKYLNVKNLNIKKHAKYTNELLKNDPYNEKHDLFLEAFVSSLENEMRKIY